MRGKSPLGKEGEELAVKLLKKQKYKIIERNYACPFGEIDIIARDGDTLSFVEVKARASLRYGSPQAAVGWSKQAKLCKAALYYIARKRIQNMSMRFDVVAIGPEMKEAEIIKNAFEFKDR